MQDTFKTLIYFLLMCILFLILVGMISSAVLLIINFLH